MEWRETLELRVSTSLCENNDSLKLLDGRDSSISPPTCRAMRSARYEKVFSVAIARSLIQV
jgi:hypothetical protein